MNVKVGIKDTVVHLMSSLVIIKIEHLGITNVVHKNFSIDVETIHVRVWFLVIEI